MHPDGAVVEDSVLLREVDVVVVAEDETVLTVVFGAAARPEWVPHPARPTSAAKTAATLAICRVTEPRRCTYDARLGP
jgi:hypothetical protein